ncbi:MAG: Uncharacterised protein [Alphaproteobacteria bacterium]|nr:MAG: Uncharacterised protein [Alphaproteobacteria bacterium]
MRIGIEPHFFQITRFLSGQRVELGQAVNLITEHFNPPSAVFIMRRKHVNRIAADAKIAARKSHIIAPILQCHQIGEQLRAANIHAFFKLQRHAGIAFHRADAVNARHGSDDNYVIAFQQRPRRGMAHAVNLLVNIAFFFDVSVGARHIGFGLVIIVIRDEILDRIFREEALKLAVKLRRQCFVGGQHKGRALGTLNDLRHGEGLAAAGYAEQHLIALLIFNAVNQFFNGLRLVAGRVKFRDHFEDAPALGLFRPIGAMRDKFDKLRFTQPRFRHRCQLATAR